jgi:hypothetical protein
VNNSTLEVEPFPSEIVICQGCRAGGGVGRVGVDEGMKEGAGVSKL